jgi:methylglutaconyl-CoA hydratase
MANVLGTKQRNYVFIITITRPEVHNAISQNVLNEFKTILEQLEKDQAIKAVVITGEGEKAFCAGADLKERQTMNEQETLAFVEKIQSTFQQIAQLPMPTIAAINGNAFGGGLELALACDLRVMSEFAIVGLTECSLGIIPGAGGTQRLPRIIGIANAMDLILLAKHIGGEEAFRLGLVNYLAKDAKTALVSALKIAERIAMNAPLAIRAAKEATMASLEKDINKGLVTELAAYHGILDSHDRKEGLTAFMEKRKPQFLGK